MSNLQTTQFYEAEHEAEQEQEYMEKKHTKMSKAKFIELIGENPEDVLGEDWENEIDEYVEDSEQFHEGHLRGGCFECKMD